MNITKNSILIIGSTVAAVLINSSYYFRGTLLEVRVRPFTTNASHFPATSVLLNVFRQSTDNERRILKMYCPSSACSWYPRLKVTTSSTGGGSVDASSSYGSSGVRMPYVEKIPFYDEKVRVKIAQCAKTMAKRCYLDVYFDGVKSL